MNNDKKHHETNINFWCITKHAFSGIWGTKHLFTWSLKRIWFHNGVWGKLFILHINLFCFKSQLGKFWIATICNVITILLYITDYSYTHLITEISSNNGMGGEYSVYRTAGIFYRI